jgi:CBS domain-containing protein/sporulation protein YlmC with PRC-barrel domain
MQEPGLKMFLFLSELLGRSVIDSQGKSIGKLVDLKVKLGELFPRIVTLRVKLRAEKTPLSLEWSFVQSLNGNIVSLKPEAEKEFKPVVLNEGEILLKEELLDKQVVDTYGSKIERINDIHLLIAEGELRIVHVDYGARGIFRRLGWVKIIDYLTNWFFAYQLPDKMISWKYIQPLASDPKKKNLKLNVTLRKLHELHPSDLADIIEEVDREKGNTIFKSLDLQTAAETLEEVEPKLQLSLIESAPEEHASDILEEMAPDEAADLLADLPEEKKRKLIQSLEKPHREQLEELLRFREGTAGSIMTKDFISIQEDKTISEAIDEFRKTTHPLETIAYLYVTDKENHLVGVLTVRHLLLCVNEAPLSKLMNTHLIKVKPDEDVKEVEEIFKKYKFMAIPVVDENDCLSGIITLRDAVESKYKEF